jgi:hypothetical protein
MPFGYTKPALFPDQGGGKRRLVVTCRLGSGDLPDCQEDQKKKSRLPSFAIGDRCEDDPSHDKQKRLQQSPAGWTSRLLPAASNLQQQRERECQRKNQTEPSSRTTPRNKPITPAITNANTASAMRAGRDLSSLGIDSGALCRP